MLSHPRRAGLRDLWSDGGQDLGPDATSSWHLAQIVPLMNETRPCRSSPCCAATEARTGQRTRSSGSIDRAIAEPASSACPRSSVLHAPRRCRPQRRPRRVGRSPTAATSPSHQWCSWDTPALLTPSSPWQQRSTHRSPPQVHHLAGLSPRFSADHGHTSRLASSPERAAERSRRAAR